MFSLEFMQTAFIASVIVAIICGLIGYFLLIRRETFAGHALSHVGFAGATGASLVGVSPFLGLLVFSLCAGGLIGVIGPKLKDRDIAIGLVLSTSMGFGLLFLHFYTRYASQVTGLLFGNIFAVDTQTLYGLIILSIVCCMVMLFFMRPLLFASMQPDLAEAKGVSLRRVSILFLGVVACVTAACVQVTGILLTFSLMVGPAAVARQLSKTVWRGLFLSIFLAVVESWGGVIIAWVTDYPASFCISLLSFLIYLLSLLLGKKYLFIKY
ncbi:metal ABC transporter permease [Commensalibacter nepenthis]|uniref:Metal ABC transporter permease n=1 Tax=Commensalibacter nepenthis TaxID=3043872 RepID=A0ABT6Q7B1_9PROT|nr:metal ABC transporter permease [Commensalibacter sp. TBRC 10068]MDI2112679.1 metal ABC transporter permease [Commensalibacter sp. TBRC 10068]